MAEVGHRRGLLDLREDRGATAREVAGLLDVGGALDEGQRQPVDAELADELQVAAVLVAQRRQRQHHVGDVDALAVGDGAPHRHRAVGEVGAAGDHLQPDLAVVDQERGAGAQRLEDLPVGEVRAGGVAGGGIEVEAEGAAHDELLRAVGEGADAQLRPLEVGEDADGRAELDLDLADDPVAGGDVLVGAMAHVEAEDIGARLVQGADHLLGGGGGAERGHDLDVAMASHGGSLRRAVTANAVSGAYRPIPFTRQLAYPGRRP